jgi:radical SAM protein with 4Fe4S-binding SPASM domain
VRTLRRVQDELGDQRTEVRWKFVVHRHHEHELERAQALARELGMTFQVVTIWTPPDQQDQWLPTSLTHTEGRNVRGGPPRCHHLWQAVSVNFNGDVFPCCSEFSPADKLVNVLEQPFAPLWNSASYRARRRINKGAVDCTRCHLDRDTNWYRTWIGKAEARDGFTEPRREL